MLPSVKEGVFLVESKTSSHKHPIKLEGRIGANGFLLPIPISKKVVQYPPGKSLFLRGLFQTVFLETCIRPD